MGELIITEFMTLDGVGQAPGRPDEDPEGGFAHGGWQAPYFDDDAGARMFELASGMDALLLGRRTYEIFAGYWPTAPAAIPFTGLLNSVPKYVASRSLTDPLSWQGATVLSGDLVDEITTLEGRHARIDVIGSLDLVQSLLRLGLVDRMTLWVYPLLLGTGKRVFARGAVPTSLRLAHSTAWANGSLELSYERAGGVANGDPDTREGSELN